MNLNFWRDRRVLLTGHTGFKGSWISLWLQDMGANLTGYALDPPTTPNLFTEARVLQGMTSHEGDIRNLDHLQQIVRETQPEIVIHMAAQPLVRYSYQNPVETYASNVMGTVHLLEAVRNTPGVKVFINVTTDKCYENQGWVWGYRENEPLGGYDPYSNSKSCSELVTSSYRSSFFNTDDYERHGVAIASVRAGNVIGGGDWAKDRLIPDILTAFQTSQAVCVRNPHAIRPWQHVLEPLRGYLVLAEKLYAHGAEYAEPWNFGPNDNDAKSVSWIVKTAADLWGNGASWHLDNAEHFHEADYLKLDISKSRSRLNWHPTLTVEEALKLTISWVRGRQNDIDIRQLTLSQINDYQRLTLSDD